MRSKNTAHVLLKCRAVIKPLQGSDCTYLETYQAKRVEVTDMAHCGENSAPGEVTFPNS